MTKHRSYVEGSQFWGPVLITAFFLSMIWTFCVAGEDSANEGAKKSLQCKEAVFAALAGQPVESYKKLDQETKEMVEIGSYLRQQWDKGQNSVLKDTAWIYEKKLDSNRRQKNLLTLQDIPSPVILMGTNKYWLAMIENSWDVQIIQELLSKKMTEPPNWKNFHPSLPTWLGWPALLFAQLICFLIYLSCWDDWEGSESWGLRTCSWYQLPWRKGWPVLGMALLMPGALPAITIYGLGVGLLVGIKSTFVFFSMEQREKRKTSSMSGFNYAADSHGQDLLTKLQKKLEAKDHV